MEARNGKQSIILPLAATNTDLDHHGRRFRFRVREHARFVFVSFGHPPGVVVIVRRVDEARDVETIISLPRGSRLACESKVDVALTIQTPFSDAFGTFRPFTMLTRVVVVTLSQLVFHKYHTYTS